MNTLRIEDYVIQFLFEEVTSVVCHNCLKIYCMESTTRYFHSVSALQNISDIFARACLMFVGIIYYKWFPLSGKTYFSKPISCQVGPLQHFMYQELHLFSCEHTEGCYELYYFSLHSDT